MLDISLFLCNNGKSPKKLLNNKNEGLKYESSTLQNTP